MVVGLHSRLAAGLIRSPHQILNNAETQTKWLMSQSTRLRRLISDFKSKIKKIKGRRAGAAHGQEAEKIVENLVDEFVITKPGYYDDTTIIIVNFK